MDPLRALIVALWIALSAFVSVLHPQAASTSLLSAAVFAIGVLKSVRVFVALSVALQLPALIAISLTRSLLHAALLMLATLYIAELGDLAAKAGGERDAGFVRVRVTQVTFVTALALPVTVAVTAAAELLSPVLDFGVAALALALLVLLTLALKGRPQSTKPVS